MYIKLLEIIQHVACLIYNKLTSNLHWHNLYFMYLCTCIDVFNDSYIRQDVKLIGKCNQLCVIV